MAANNIPKAQIVRGNQTICAFDEDGKKVKVKQEEPKQDVEKSEVRRYQAKQVETAHTKENDIVRQCKNAISRNAISYATAASCIVGEIRCIYFKSITKPICGYDIETLAYMDKILFNNLSNIIEGIIHYGSRTIEQALVNQVLLNAIQTLEVQVAIDDMIKVIDRVYVEF